MTSQEENKNGESVNIGLIIILVSMLAVLGVLVYNNHNLIETVPDVPETNPELVLEVNYDSFPGVSSDRLWHIVAVDEGITYNVQIDGFDVIAYGNGMIKEVVADTEDVDYRIKIMPDMSVAAITPDGELHPVVAVTDDGDLPVVGIFQHGHTIDIKAVRSNGNVAELLGVKAFNDRDNTCHVKGIDVLEEGVDGEVFGVEYYAHVKALCSSNE